VCVRAQVCVWGGGVIGCPPAVLHCTVLSAQCHAVSCRASPCHAAPYHAVPCCAVSLQVFKVDLTGLPMPDAHKALLMWLREETRTAQGWYDFWRANEWHWVDDPEEEEPSYLTSMRTGCVCVRVLAVVVVCSGGGGGAGQRRVVPAGAVCVCCANALVC
jgi:hypothetical protein